MSDMPRWLGQHGAELVELDEILGYHLEQAARYKTELGQTDPSWPRGRQTSCLCRKACVLAR